MREDRKYTTLLASCLLSDPKQEYDPGSTDTGGLLISLDPANIFRTPGDGNLADRYDEVAKPSNHDGMKSCCDPNGSLGDTIEIF